MSTQAGSSLAEQKTTVNKSESEGTEPKAEFEFFSENGSTIQQRFLKLTAASRKMATAMSAANIEALRMHANAKGISLNQNRASIILQICEQHENRLCVSEFCVRDGRGGFGIT